MIGEADETEVGGIAVALAVWVAASLIVIVPLWRLCTRIGFPGFFALTGVFPLLAIALLWFLAFVEWPSTDSTDADEK